MKIRQSTNLSDIYDVNMRSAGSYGGICICELGTLDELIGMEKAEIIRKKLLKNNVKTKQLTNRKALKEWTAVNGFVSETMEIRYISPHFFAISYEILIFDDTVAIYRDIGGISYLEINDITYAQALRQLFESVWLQAKSMTLNSKGGARIKK